MLPVVFWYRVAVLTDYVTYCVLQDSLLRVFMSVSFKLLCPKNITFSRGLCYRTGGGGEKCMGRRRYYVLVMK